MSSISLAHSVISTARETRGTLGEKLGQPESKSSFACTLSSLSTAWHPGRTVEGIALP